MNKLYILLILLIFSTLITPVYANDDENVNLMDFPKYLSERLGLPSDGDYFAGKLLASTIFLMLFLLPTLFACGKFGVAMLIPGLLVGLTVLGFCVALGWMPVWFFVIIILMISLMYASKMAEIFGGRGGAVT